MTDLAYVEHCLLLPDAKERHKSFVEDAHLRRILPEVYRLAQVPQPPDYHPEGDALTHTLLAVRHLPPDPDRRLAWAALLHDVGKAVTTQVVDGRIRAFGHDVEGAEMAAASLRRLGMGEAMRAEVVWLIRHHMFALSWQRQSGARLTRRQRRLVAEPLFALLLDLMEVDALASGPNEAKLAEAAFYRRQCARLAGDGGA